MYFDVADIIVPVWWLLAWGGLVGLVFSTVGAVIGPVLSKYLPENALRAFLCLVLVVIGLRYAGVFSGRTIEKASQHTLPFLPTNSYSNSATYQGFQYSLSQRQKPPVDLE